MDRSVVERLYAILEREQCVAVGFRECVRVGRLRVSELTSCIGARCRLGAFLLIWLNRSTQYSPVHLALRAAYVRGCADYVGAYWEVMDAACLVEEFERALRLARNPREYAAYAKRVLEEFDRALSGPLWRYKSPCAALLMAIARGDTSKAQHLRECTTDIHLADASLINVKTSTRESGEELAALLRAAGAQEAARWSCGTTLIAKTGNRTTAVTIRWC